MLVNMKPSTTSEGFTLIELMIVVAIIGIIAAIGYPSYQESTAKARRSDGQGALLGFASALERHYAENNNYLGTAVDADTNGALDNTGPPASIFPAEAPLDGTNKFYDLSLTTIDAAGQTYTLQATPKNVMAGDRCGNLTYTSAGARGADETDCWR
jgi:type IV pilus assembly protein PilE